MHHLYNITVGKEQHDIVVQESANNISIITILVIPLIQVQRLV